MKNANVEEPVTCSGCSFCDRRRRHKDDEDGEDGSSGHDKSDGIQASDILMLVLVQGRLLIKQSIVLFGTELGN